MPQSLRNPGGLVQSEKMKVAQRFRARNQNPAGPSFRSGKTDGIKLWDLLEMARAVPYG